MQDKEKQSYWEPWEDEVDSWQVFVCNRSKNINCVDVTILGVIKLASFGFINMMLMTMCGIETNPGPCTNPTNDGLRTRR